MSIRDAVRQFDDSFIKYQHSLAEAGRSGREPDPDHADKFNLYAGLSNMAEGIEQIQSDLNKIKRKLEIP